MAWTAASIVPSVGSVINRRAPGTPGNSTMTQVGSSMPVPTGSSSMPAFLNNPSGFLGNQFLPYADLISRILTPQAAPSLPPALAQAYANQALANTERLEMQNAATRAQAALPRRINELQSRESMMRSAPWSLSGLPTGLGYQDPLRALQDNTFALRAQTFGAPALSPINSGWLSPGLY